MKDTKVNIQKNRILRIACIFLMVGFQVNGNNVPVEESNYFSRSSSGRYSLSEHELPGNRIYDVPSGKEQGGFSLFREDEGNEIRQDEFTMATLADITEGESELGGFERPVPIGLNFFFLLFLGYGYILFRHKRKKKITLD